MHPPDTAAIEQAAWSTFVAELADQLAAQWPAMPERLGDRYAAFVDLAVQQAEKRGITRAAAVARYVNLWFVWGPAFHDKPGFEWALGMLAAPREREWGTVHQLVQRSMVELKRLPDARIAPEALAAADARLADRFGPLGARGNLNPEKPPPAPLRACDLEAAELRLLEPAVAQRYVLQQGQWQRADIAQPAPLRIDAAHPVPPLVAVLALAPGQLPAARLQLRARSHASCDGDLHPAVNCIGSHGLWRWQGHETRAFSWPVTAPEPGPPLAAPGIAIGVETPPDINQLVIEVCGLRDEGDAIGAMKTMVWAWPAEQWWVEVQRAAPEMRSQASATAASAAAPSATRCRVERDGVALDAAPLREGFEKGLDAATAQAMQKLLAAWSGIKGLSAPRLEGSLAMLTGRAGITWGWSLGAGGLEGRAFLRLLGELKMQAVQADVQLEGEITVGDARARIFLRCMDRAPLEQSIAREAIEPELVVALVDAVVRFRMPFIAELIPLAGETGAVLQTHGPCTGALVGEAGLRPRVWGGGGFEWFCSLRVEAVTLPLTQVDPLLGTQRVMLPLLPETMLLDWRLG